MHFFVHDWFSLTPLLVLDPLEERGSPRRIADYLLTIPDIISISASAAAIFSADDGCGRPPNMNDISGK